MAQPLTAFHDFNCEKCKYQVQEGKEFKFFNNGYTEETADNYHIERDSNKITLFKKIAEEVFQ